MVRAGVLIALLGLARPTAGLPQYPIDTVLGRLKPGQVVRVRTSDGRRVTATFREVNGDPLTLRLYGNEAPVDVRLIDSLWVRRRVTTAGAIVGGVVSGVPSFLFWNWLCRLAEESSSCPRMGLVVAYSALGAAGGALIGGMIGAGIQRWPLRYPRFADPATPIVTHGHALGLQVSITF